MIKKDEKMLDKKKNWGIKKEEEERKKLKERKSVRCDGG